LINVVAERVDLGEAGPIDGVVQQMARLIARGQIAPQPFQRVLRRLSDLIYAPLSKYLTNVAHLVVCPDGQLSRVPFGMLLQEGNHMFEQKTITCVASGREVARLAQTPSKSTANMPVVMGNADFDFDLSGGVGVVAATSQHGNQRDGPRSVESQIGDARFEIDRRLPASAMRSLSRSCLFINWLFSGWDRDS
jgi:CHAT domain